MSKNFDTILSPRRHTSVPYSLKKRCWVIVIITKQVKIRSVPSEAPRNTTEQEMKTTNNSEDCGGNSNSTGTVENCLSVHP